MVTFTSIQGYANTYGVQYAVKPRQPTYGNRSITSSAELTIVEYDIITPYGMETAVGDGGIVSNPDQTTRFMVGWGMILHLSLLTAQAMTLRVYVNSGVTSTYTQIDTSPIAIAALATWQQYTSPVLPAAFIRATLQAVGTTATVEYHSSISDY